jgi:DNA-binding NarL/FixJ family response regulator
MSTVLVCDDSPLAREALRRAVATVAGVERVIVAGSGEECLVRFSAERPDLVLVDVRMPGIGGVEAARRITADHPEIVVVLISIDGPGSVAAEASLCGAAELVRKQEFGPRMLRRLWDAHGAGT